MVKKIIKLKGEWYRLLFTEAEIQEKINILTHRIKDYYEKSGKVFTLVAISVGGLFFAIDLAKKLSELGVEFIFEEMRLKSRNDDKTSRDVKISHEPFSENIGGKNVLVVDDLADDGKSMNSIKNYFESLESSPEDIQYCLLITKKGHQFKTRIKFVGFSQVARIWLVGYGMDLKQLYRGLSNIYAKCNTEKVLRQYGIKHQENWLYSNRKIKKILHKHYYKKVLK